METIDFSTNWNNKLQCHAFTTIRLFNPNKYRVNSVYRIERNKHFLMQAAIIAIKPFMLHDLNDFMAYLDTGYNASECKLIIQRMYSKVDFSKTQLSMILLVKVADAKTMNTVF
jgi:hypothetical protein